MHHKILFFLSFLGEFGDDSGDEIIINTLFYLEGKRCVFAADCTAFD